MGNYQGYQQYKNSGVEWLGDIPEHWEVDRIKWSVHSFKNGVWGNEPDGENDIFCIRVADFNRESLTVNLENLTIRAIEKKERKDRLLKKGDLLLEKSGGGENQLVGTVVQYNHDFIAVTSNFIAKMEVSDFVNSRFIVYLHSHLYFCHVNYCSIKQTTGIQNIDSQHYLNQKIVYPPLHEQQKIAQFLDYKTKQIDELIKKKETLIEKLDEKRTALISHAVTKGLDSSVPMKDSGIEWIGNIPQHWKKVMIKRVSKTEYKSFTDGDWIESPYIAESGVRLLQTGNVGIGYYKEQGFRYISEETFEKLRCTEILPNDILVCRLDGPVGRACLVPNLGERMITSVDNAILKVSKEFDYRFIVYLMSSNLWLEWIQSLCRVGGGFRFRISRTILGEQLITYPPIEEQREIANFLDQKTTQIDLQKAKIKQAIELLKEYRTSLITNAVTGKIDVRQIAIP